MYSVYYGMYMLSEKKWVQKESGFISQKKKATRYLVKMAWFASITSSGDGIFTAL